LKQVLTEQRKFIKRTLKFFKKNIKFFQCHVKTCGRIRIQSDPYIIDSSGSGSGSVYCQNAGSGSGSDPYIEYTDPQHCFEGQNVQSTKKTYFCHRILPVPIESRIVSLSLHFLPSGLIPKDHFLSDPSCQVITDPDATYRYLPYLN